MTELDEFLDGAAALLAAVFVLGMLASAAHSAHRGRRAIAAATRGTAVGLRDPGTGERVPLSVGAPPDVYKRYRLLITKCSDPHMWYADKIGQEVPYLGTWPAEGSHKSREDAGFINIVKIIDACIIVKEVKVSKPVHVRYCCLTPDSGPHGLSCGNMES